MLYPEPYEIGSVEKGKLLTSGNLKFHNELIKTSNHSLWEIQGTDVALDYYLHGFSWLNDLTAVGSYEALKLAQKWVFHWTLNELGNENLYLDIFKIVTFATFAISWITFSYMDGSYSFVVPIMSRVICSPTLVINYPLL